MVETGLGGVRDATNVFSAAVLKLAVITAIGLEHQRALGGTLTEIAAAKAGIMKPGRPVVIARQPEQAAAHALQQAAEAAGCPVIEPAAAVQLQPQARPATPCWFTVVTHATSHRKLRGPHFRLGACDK